MARRIVSLAVGVAVVVTTACGGGDEVASAGGWAGTVDTLAGGGVRVSSPAEGIWEEGEAWRLVEDLRIGSLEGDGPELFGEIDDLAVDGAGRIYVLEPQAHEVRVFAPDGTWIRTLGGYGAGPGELNVSFGGEVLIGQDGRLWINNSRNRRWELFSADGDFVTSIPQLSSTFFGTESLVGRDGAIYQRHHLRVDGAEPRPVVFRFEPAGDSLPVTDTLDVPEVPEADNISVTISNASAEITMGIPVPFVHQAGWRIDPAGFFWAEPGDGYRLVALSAELDTLRIVERAYDPVPVTADEVEEALAQYADGPLADALSGIDRSRIPDHHPPIDRYLTDDAGQLWVRRRSGEDRWAWDVFDPEGRYLGAVATEVDLDRLTVHEIRDGAVYGVLRDELDVPWVVRLRIEEAGSPK